MREIKFRAWHPTNKVMHIFDLIKATSDVYIAQHFIELLNNTHSEGSDLLMQYTGLKDKNGVEIYNGDILRFEDKWEWYRSPFLSANEINEILNNHEKYPYEQRLVELPESYEWLLSSEIQSFWAVIGNIHENPELMEKNND